MTWKDNQQVSKKGTLNLFYKKSGIYLISIITLFVVIGFLTTIKPAYRFSSQTISDWTSEIDSSTFLYLLGMENRAFKQAYPKDKTLPDLSSTLFQMATNMKPNDPRSFLGTEIPGFSIYDSRILIAGEGTNYTNLPFESSPPLEEVLKDREAIADDESTEEELELDQDKDKDKPTTGDRDVVFIYSTHNRESFLPILPDVTEANQAFHDKENITKVSNRLAKSLQAKGIGTNVDDTDIASVLREKGWGRSQSYNVSRNVVEEAFASNHEIQYVFDLHRDAMGRDITAKEINGKSYARIMIVVGEEYETFEKNLELASKLHHLMDEKYPGLSRGVLPKKGAGTNGVFNQDLSENAILFEFGGVENTMEELYRSADALAEVFSEFYWDAEKVEANP